MPARIPKPAPPALEPVKPTPAPGITHAELDAILTARDAVWAKHLEAMTKALVAAIPKPQPAPPRKPSKIKFETDGRGFPTGFTITPEN